MTVRVKSGTFIRSGFFLFALGVLAACSSASSTGSKADYTVRGNSSVYEEQDSRVYVQAPVFTDLKSDGIHDPVNEAINTLQQPEKAMKDFPADRRGAVNWAQAIEQGIVDPRMSLRGEEEMNIMDMDMLFKDTGDMPWVRFPHLAHTRWLDCSNCHPKIFVPQRGGNPEIGMDAIIAGNYCGRCHDKVAFPLWTCERCHSVTHKGSPTAWWREQDGPIPQTSEARHAWEREGQL